MAETKKGAAPETAAEPATPAQKRPRLSQEDVPGYSLEQALRVPRAIGSYGYKPTRPLNVAVAMKMSPASGPFRGITGAAIAFGLTSGGAQGGEIAITPLGMRIVRPTAEGDDMAAKREALLRPKVVGEFLRQYDGSALPTDEIAKNVLQEKGVPAERLDDVLKLIVDGAKAVGFIRESGGKRYVDLTAAITLQPADDGSAGTGPTAMPATTVTPKALATTTPAVSVSPDVHVNIEIHIAADASSQVIEAIFKNMRRYVLSRDGQAQKD
ncbi:MAG: hypothetical protein WEE67_06260 [Chloroflexota bacterium]